MVTVSDLITPMAIPYGSKAAPVENWQVLDDGEHVDLLAANKRNRQPCNLAYRLDRCLVVDADSAEAEAHIQNLKLPATPTVRTWRGRLHRYFLPCDGAALKTIHLRCGPIKIDIQAGRGAYVVAPGSFIEEKGGKGKYDWEPGLGPELEVATIPLTAWNKLLALKNEGTGKTKTPIKSPKAITEGARNDTLFRLACSLRHKDFSPEAILAAVLAENVAKCSPSLEATEVKGIVESALRYEPKAEVAEPRRPKSFTLTPEVAHELNELHRTDLGNAYRFLLLTHDRIRWCRVSGPHKKGYDGWVVWTGKVWQRYAHDLAFRAMQRVAATQYVAAGCAPDLKTQEELAKWAISSERRNVVDNSLAHASFIGEMAIPAEEWDREPYLLNVQNGVVDLRTGEMRKHDPALDLTQIAATYYDPEAKCPQWDAFLEFAFSGNRAIINHVQRMVGYSCCGTADEQCFWLLLGPGENGKNTFVMTLRRILGDDYSMHFDPDTILMNGKVTYEQALMEGKRLIETDEIGRRQLNEPLLKAMVAGDTTSARMIYGFPLSFEPTATLFMSSNSEPVIKDSSWGMWRRVVRLDFPNRVPVKKRIKDYAKKLFTEEAPGILAWAVRGAVLWHKDGLAVPDEVKDATRQYELSMCPVEAWKKDCVKYVAQKDVVCEAFYASYKTWAESHGTRVLQAPEFGQEITHDTRIERTRVRHGGNRVYVYRGVELVNADQ